MMSVWLPVKMCIWDQQFTYFVRNSVSSNVLFLSDTFSRGAVIFVRSPRSGLAIKLVASRPDDELIDLIADSISGVIILSIAVKIAFWILSSTVSKQYYTFPCQSFQKNIFLRFSHLPHFS